MAISDDDDDDRSLCFDCERRVSVSVSVRGGEVIAKNFNLMNKHN
jgi:hypothetical protein